MNKEKRLNEFNKVMQEEGYKKWNCLDIELLNLSDTDFKYFLETLKDEVIDIVVNDKKTVVGVCGIDENMYIGIYSIDFYLKTFGDTYIKNKI